MLNLEFKGLLKNFKLILISIYNQLRTLQISDFVNSDVFKVIINAYL